LCFYAGWFLAGIHPVRGEGDGLLVVGVIDSKAAVLRFHFRGHVPQQILGRERRRHAREPLTGTRERTLCPTNLSRNGNG
jgi:hypothetical protein